MKSICAWCRKELNWSEAAPHPEEMISHGICESCLENMFFQMGVGIEHYLDSLIAPVIVVSDNGEIVTANSQACSQLGKSVDEMRNKLGGVVFECAYARLPEGCGKSIHCSACAVRRTVMDTFKTGKGHYKVPAILNHETEGEISLVISTEKAGNTVLLRVDRFG